MSTSELDRFARDLNANWTLRGDAEKYESKSNQNNPPLVRMTAFATKQGYTFTIEEAKEYAKAKGKELGFHISDADLDRVTGFPYAGGVLGIITGDF